MKKTFFTFIDNPCFYMLAGLLSGRLAQFIFGGGYPGSAAYSLLSVAVPLVLYMKSGHRFEGAVRHSSYKIIIPAFLIWAMGNTVNSLFNFLLEGMGIEAYPQLIKSETAFETFLSFLCVCITAPVCEEILYRGIILKSSEKYGKEAAVLISSLLFSLAHGSVTVFAMPFIFGIFSAICMQKSGSLGGCIFMHMLCNTLSWILSVTDSPDFINIFILISGILSLFPCIFYAFRRKSKVYSSLRGFNASLDIWWIIVLTEYILINILHHGG